MKKMGDEYFLQATNFNKHAYDLIYEWFVESGIIIAVSKTKNSNTIDFNVEEAKLQLSDLFLTAIRLFEPGRIPFEKFAMFLIRKRINKLIEGNSTNITNKVLSLDDEIGDGFTLLDMLESDDYEQMNYKIDNSSKKHYMASTKIKTIKIDRRINIMLDLREKGYRKREIMKMMRLTDGQYRYISRVLYDFEHGRGRIEVK